jgi:hypothetical protein
MKTAQMVVCAAGACLLLAGSGRGQTFSFGKDTVYETASEFLQQDDSVSLHNNEADTIMIDTILVLRDSTVLAEYFVTFFVSPWPTGMVGVYEYGYNLDSRNRPYYPLYCQDGWQRILLRGAYTVYLKEFYLDCDARPLPKRTDGNAADLEYDDTAAVRLVFVAGLHADTLTVVGRYRPVSVGKAPAANDGRAQFAAGGNTYNIHGQRLGHGKAQERSAKVVVRVSEAGEAECRVGGRRYGKECR